jgi:hypothetical protein
VRVGGSGRVALFATRGGTSETLRDLIGKRIMEATDLGEDLLAYDLLQDVAGSCD